MKRSVYTVFVEYVWQKEHNTKGIATNWIKKVMKQRFFEEKLEVIGPRLLRPEVRILSGTPNQDNPNLIPIGEGFGFIVFLAPSGYRNQTKRRRKK